MPLESWNPATGELLEKFDELTPAQAEAVLKKAHEAFAGWRQSEFGERRRLLLQAARILAEEKEDLARLMSVEMGKPVSPVRS